MFWRKGFSRALSAPVTQIKGNYRRSRQANTDRLEMGENSPGASLLPGLRSAARGVAARLRTGDNPDDKAGKPAHRASGKRCDFSYFQRFLWTFLYRLRLHAVRRKRTMALVRTRGIPGVFVRMGAVGVALERGEARRTEDTFAPVATLRSIRSSVMNELSRCRIVVDLMRGIVRREDYVAYLSNVQYYARYSPMIMAAAGSRCSSTHPELALYLFQHAAEEHGHDGWAIEDLAKLGVDREKLRHARPVAACAAMVGYVRSLAHCENPTAVFGWMYVLEAVGADVGEIARAKLRDASDGAPSNRFVAGHCVADAHHIEDIERVIRDHLLEENDRAEVCEAARVVADLYLTMFRQIGGEHPQWVSQ